MGALIGIGALFVAVFRLCEWAFHDHEEADLALGLIAAVISGAAFLIARMT